MSRARIGAKTGIKRWRSTRQLVSRRNIAIREKNAGRLSMEVSSPDDGNCSFCPQAHLAPAQAAVGTLVLPRRLFSRRNSVMNVRDERTRSLWMYISVADAPALSRAERADVAVIGAGIAGRSVAYELANRGRSVV